MKILRQCSGKNQFNTGKSRCPVKRGKIKAIILVESGASLPDNINPESMEKAFHADRPNRLYGLKTIEEYAPSGGEAQTSQQGYGANKISAYSALTEAYTLDDYDMGIVANIVSAMNVPLDAYLVNDEDYIFGLRRTNGPLKGFPLSGTYVTTQRHDTSGQIANMIINLMYKDVEELLQYEDVIYAGYNVASSVTGLVEVNFSEIEAGKYKLYEVSGSLDITGYYGDLIASKASMVLSGATGVSYADGVITATGAMKLAKPSVLQANGIIGIEQVGTDSTSSGDDEYIDPEA